jgi:hypothetical protein
VTSGAQLSYSVESVTNGQLDFNALGVDEEPEFLFDMVRFGFQEPPPAYIDGVTDAPLYEILSQIGQKSC